MGNGKRELSFVTYDAIATKNATVVSPQKIFLAGEFVRTSNRHDYALKPTGPTVLNALKDAGLDAGYYKAAVSGAERDEENGTLRAGDALYVKEIAELSETQEELVSYVYEAAVSPHLAAQLDNNPIDFGVVEKDFRRALSTHDYITMEGSGGIICPLRWDKKEHLVLDDLVKKLGLGALVVADAGLGTINAAALTVSAYSPRPTFTPKFR